MNGLPCTPLANVFECCICMEEEIARDNIATIVGCEHKFCFVCVTRWSETKSKSLIVLIFLSLRSNTTLTIQFASDACPLCQTRFTSIKSGGVLVHVPDTDSRSRVLEEDTEDEDQSVDELALILSNIAIVLNQWHSISEEQCLTALRTLERVLQIGLNNNDDAYAEFVYVEGLTCIIEELQYCRSNDVYHLAYSILDNFFE